MKNEKRGDPLYKNIAAAVAFVALLLAGLVLSEPDSYHNFEGRCLDCHLKVPKAGERPNIFVKDISSLCLSCHEDLKEMSHPVDVSPPKKMRIPRSLPLDWKGDVTCTTCHTAHKKGHGRYMLRVDSYGEPFCLLCHNDLEEELHKSNIGSAHMRSSIRARYIPGSRNLYIDDLSLRCMVCHDAFFAKESLVSKPRAGGRYYHGMDIGLSHPIGVSYLEARARFHGAYRPVEELPKEIILFDGMVGCGSCHNPYSKRHYDLVMSNEGSALCLACHVK